MMPTSNEGMSAAKEPRGRSLRVQVNVQKTLGDADLEGLRGVCVWNLPTESDDPMRQAWKKAGFTHPRWPFLSCGVSWRRESNGSRSMVLDFDPLDALLDGCRSMGIVPLFSFSDIPKALSSNPDLEVSEFDSPSHYGPADYGEWEQYVTRVVGRVVERGYTGGYYEVWNEPEDFKYCWKGQPGSKDTLADYLRLYLHTARGIKGVDPTAKVGGPVCAHWDSVTVSRGTHAWGLPQFLKAIGQYRNEHPEEDVPLDFVDWHDYSFATTVLSDGVDFVDRVLAEVGWPGRPENLITEWNRHLGWSHDEEKTVSPLQRAAHASWNVIREVNSEIRRIARLYWYVLDGGWDVALVDGPPRARLEPKADASHTYGLSPTFAVFEMLRALNQGQRLQVAAEGPLVALATMHEGALRLMVTNNTVESHSTGIELQDIPGPLRQTRCRIQRVDEQHSSDGKGLEEGEETTWQVGPGAPQAQLSLLPYATVSVTLQVHGQ